MLFVPTSRAALNASPKASHGRTSALLSVGRLVGAAVGAGLAGIALDGTLTAADRAPHAAAGGARLPRRRDPGVDVPLRRRAARGRARPELAGPGCQPGLLAGLLGPVGPHLLAVAAHGHVAPAPGPVAAGVIERPLAVIGDARLHARPAAVHRGVGHRDQQPGQDARDSPRRAGRSRSRRRAPKRTESRPRSATSSRWRAASAAVRSRWLWLTSTRAQRLAQLDRLLELARPELRWAPGRAAPARSATAASCAGVSVRSSPVSTSRVLTKSMTS